MSEMDLTKAMRGMKSSLMKKRIKTRGDNVDDEGVEGDDDLGIIDFIHDINIQMQQEQMALGSLK